MLGSSTEPASRPFTTRTMLRRNAKMDPHRLNCCPLAIAAFPIERRTRSSRARRHYIECRSVCVICESTNSQFLEGVLLVEWQLLLILVWAQPYLTTSSPRPLTPAEAEGKLCRPPRRNGRRDRVGRKGTLAEGGSRTAVVLWAAGGGVAERWSVGVVVSGQVVPGCHAT
jgi:hypothetical protein